jgi:hypothetical protein
LYIIADFFDSNISPYLGYVMLPLDQDLPETVSPSSLLPGWGSTLHTGGINVPSFAVTRWQYDNADENSGIRFKDALLRINEAKEVIAEAAPGDSQEFYAHPHTGLSVHRVGGWSGRYILSLTTPDVAYLYQRQEHSNKERWTVHECNLESFPSYRCQELRFDDHLGLVVIKGALADWGELGFYVFSFL